MNGKFPATRKRNIIELLSQSLILFVLASFLVACSRSQPPVNVDANGAAIKGYDPVAYFTAARPIQGKQEFAFEWHGAQWWFASQENRRLFMADPEKFSPQYGGYCAYAVSRGSTADIDPEAWSIENSKLYLNLNKKIQGIWTQDMAANIDKADRNWPAVLHR